jgi:hypothetical protein
MARKGDLVVLQVDNITQVIQDVLDYKAKMKSLRTLSKNKNI